MQTLYIDRLVLNLSGLSETRAREVALKVSEGLAAADIPRLAVENPGTIRLDLRPSARDSNDVDGLAGQIVCNIVQELLRLA